ncbi:hypothetical protein SADUNF_Sadunf04G0065100 [Salix dunnii]|uniref:PIN-like protein n=1 Tax=Salix dunnii TaxID=1413687 RepID=A0A835N0I0_9ROSI|nr:hypothetical protein SADUNF_Sadunf04G0065100 [Salix dunnii]
MLGACIVQSSRTAGFAGEFVKVNKIMETFLASVHKKKSEGEDVKSIEFSQFLIVLTLFGVVLAHPKVHFVPKATLKLLSKLVFALFLPCLIFTQLGPSISVKNIIQWWFIPVNVIISTAIGCILSCLVAFKCPPPREFVRFTIIMTALILATLAIFYWQ